MPVTEALMERVQRQTCLAIPVVWWCCDAVLRWAGRYFLFQTSDFVCDGNDYVLLSGHPRPTQSLFHCPLPPFLSPFPSLSPISSAALLCILILGCHCAHCTQCAAWRYRELLCGVIAQQPISGAACFQNIHTPFAQVAPYLYFDLFERFWCICALKGAVL